MAAFEPFCLGCRVNPVVYLPWPSIELSGLVKGLFSRTSSAVVDAVVLLCSHIVAYVWVRNM